MGAQSGADERQSGFERGTGPIRRACAAGSKIALCDRAHGAGPARLSFAGLTAHVGQLCNDLARRGVRNGTPVGIVLPNGPEMATAFLAVSSLATAAPLNPAYGEEEFRFYLSDLDVKLLLCGQGMGESARDAAKSLGLPVLDVVVPEGAPAPLVAQGVTFAVPHTMLGEEVGAAIVLEAGATADAEQIRNFARSRIVEFKVPRHILFLAEIPKGPTGKIERVGLAGRLGLV
jgi:acyl-CoA synthetase (AMP-forming)/AMP-acid ligase II